MSITNGATPATTEPADFIEQELQKIRSEEALDLADDAELGLPASYDDEIAAGQGVEHADNLLSIRWKILAAKLSHQDDEVTKLTVSELASRAILTQIKRERPRAYAILQWALAERAKNLEQNRKKAAQAAEQAAQSVG